MGEGCGVGPPAQNPEGMGGEALPGTPKRWVRGVCVGGGSNPWMHPSPGVPTSLAVLEELLMLREVMAVGATLPPPPSCPLPPPLFPQLEDIIRTVLFQKTYLDNCYVTTKIINASCNGKGGPQLWHPLPNPMGAHKPPPTPPESVHGGPQ